MLARDPLLPFAVLQYCIILQGVATNDNWFGDSAFSHRQSVLPFHLWALVFRHDSNEHHHPLALRRGDAAVKIANCPPPPPRNDDDGERPRNQK